MKCQLYRFWINRELDDNRPSSARVARHLAGCEPCRRWYEHQSRLVQRLQAGRRTAGAITPSAATAAHTAAATEVAPPFLRARILNAIKADARRETPVSITRWAWVGAAMAAVALAVIIERSPTERDPALARVAPAERAATSVPTSAADFIEATTRFANGGRLLQVATNLDQPLQREMHLVLDDARAALRSLQSEFIPGTLLAKRD